MIFFATFSLAPLRDLKTEPTARSVSRKGAKEKTQGAKKTQNEDLIDLSTVFE